MNSSNVTLNINYLNLPALLYMNSNVNYPLPLPPFNEASYTPNPSCLTCTVAGTLITVNFVFLFIVDRPEARHALFLCHRQQILSIHGPAMQTCLKELFLTSKATTTTEQGEAYDE